MWVSGELSYSIQTVGVEVPSAPSELPGEGSFKKVCNGEREPRSEWAKLLQTSQPWWINSFIFPSCIGMWPLPNLGSVHGIILVPNKNASHLLLSYLCLYHSIKEPTLLGLQCPTCLSECNFPTLPSTSSSHCCSSPSHPGLTSRRKTLHLPSRLFACSTHEADHYTTLTLLHS